MLNAPPQPGRQPGWQEACSQPQISPTKITPDAAAFLDNALDTMRQHALHGQSVDWTACGRKPSNALAAPSIPSTRTRRSIGPWCNWVIRVLTFACPPGLYPEPDRTAATGGARCGEQRACCFAGTHIHSTPFTSRRLPEGHIVSVQGRNLATSYFPVVLPRITTASYCMRPTCAAS